MNLKEWSLNKEKINNNNLLTIIVTLYENSDEEIENLISLEKEIKKIEGVQIIFVNDKPENNDKYRSLFSDSILYLQEKNIGKYQIVKNSLNHLDIQTPWIKVLDPDDTIYIKDLENVIEILKDAIDIPVVVTKFRRAEASNKILTQNEMENLEISKMGNLVNANTILPTNEIRFSVIDAYNQTKSSDVLLSIAATLKSNKRILEVDNAFYVYKFNNGISNNIKAKNRRERDGDLRLINEMITFLEIANKYARESNIKSPSFHHLRWSNNNLINKNISLKSRIKILSRIFDLVKENFLIKKEFREVEQSIWRIEWNKKDWIKFVLLPQFFRREINSVNLDLKMNYKNELPATKKNIVGRTAVMISDINQIDFALSNAYFASLNTKNKVNFKIVTNFHSKSLEKKIIVLNNSIKNRGLSSNIEIIMVDENKLPKFESKISFITSITNLRVFLHEIMPKDFNEQILYLDNDLYIDGDLYEIFDFVGQEEGHFARTWHKDSWWKQKLSKITNNDLNHYFNTGVMILDIKKMREENITEKATKFYAKFNEHIKYADQDILNSILDFNPLPRNFNIARYVWDTEASSETSKKNFRNIGIYHFLGQTKPWNSHEENKEFIELNSIGNLSNEEYFEYKEKVDSWKEQFEKYKNIVFLENDFENEKEDHKKGAITLLICGHKNWEYIDYFIDVIEKNDSNVKFLFAFDNQPWKYYVDILNQKNIDFIISERNEGKFNLVANASKIIQTQWVKIIDYDDVIDYRLLEDLSSKIKEINDNSLIIHSGAKIMEESSKLWGVQSTKDNVLDSLLENSKDVEWSVPPNAKTIYPAEVFDLIRRNLNNIHRQDYINDNLITYITWMMYERQENYIENKFYIQHHAFGQTRKVTLRKIENILTLFDNVLLIAEKENLNPKYIAKDIDKDPNHTFDYWYNKYKNEHSDKRFERHSGSLDYMKVKLQRIIRKLENQINEKDEGN